MGASSRCFTTIFSLRVCQSLTSTSWATSGNWPSWSLLGRLWLKRGRGWLFSAYLYLCVIIFLRTACAGNRFCSIGTTRIRTDLDRQSVYFCWVESFPHGSWTRKRSDCDATLHFAHDGLNQGWNNYYSSHLVCSQVAVYPIWRRQRSLLASWGCLGTLRSGSISVQHCSSNCLLTSASPMMIKLRTLV